MELAYVQKIARVLVRKYRALKKCFAAKIFISSPLWEIDFSNFERENVGEKSGVHANVFPLPQHSIGICR